MQQVADRIYRLGTRVHNFYVVEDRGRATVVDAGCSKEWNKLVEGLASIGLMPGDVEAILVTHAHSDHLGFGKQAQEAGLSIKVHEEEETRALGKYTVKAAVEPKELPLWRPVVWTFLVSLVRVGVMSRAPLASVETVQDGEDLDLPGRPRVVHTPGHTEGHAAFLFTERRALFTGDALATVDLIGDGTGSGPQLMNDKFHNDPALARQSLDRLAAQDADLVLPGHGDPWRGSPAEAAAAARG